MKRKILVLAAVASIAVGGAWVYLCATSPDDSHHSLQYRRWKDGRIPFREGFKGAFMADPDKGSIVLGRTRAELARVFPPLTEGKKNEKYWGEFYTQFRSGDEFVWLWGSNWLVVLRDGKAIHLHYLKG
jgi:hypothetical protein